METCLTCEHWGGNSRAFNGCNFESFRQATGRCYCSGVNNPHYYNQDYLSANDGCSFWKRHQFFITEEEKLRKFAEKAAREAAEIKAAEEERREHSENLRKAEQGDMEAQFKLGEYYSRSFFGSLPGKKSEYYEEEFEKRTKTYAEAVKWFEKAADQGHAGAKEWLAKEEPEAKEKRKAWEGDAEAQFNVGISYFTKGLMHKTGRDGNYAEAGKWLQKAADQGHAGAKDFLIRIERTKAGAKRNKVICCIIGGIIGGIVGYIFTLITMITVVNETTPLYNQRWLDVFIMVNTGMIISIIIGTIIGVVVSTLVGIISEKSGENALGSDLSLGALFFGIAFAIFYAIIWKSFGAFLSGALMGAIVGGIGSLIKVIACIKLRK